MTKTKQKRLSRKDKVRALFDAQGPEAAFTLGRRLKLQDSTLRSWFSHWRGAKGGAR
jgi:hypothetical protein